MPSKAKYTVFASQRYFPEKTFSTKKSIRSWIMEGLRGTEGAERDHYVSMLLQLDEVKTRIDYDKVM